MGLIKMVKVEKMTGFNRVTIAKKVAKNTFPKQAFGEIGATKPYLWDESTVREWLNEFDAKALFLNEKGCAVYTISKKLNSTPARVTESLERQGVVIVEQSERRLQQHHLFNLILQTSAQLTNNRGI